MCKERVFFSLSRFHDECSFILYHHIGHVVTSHCVSFQLIFSMFVCVVLCQAVPVHYVMVISGFLLILTNGCEPFIRFEQQK